MTGTWASGWATGDIVTAAEFKKSAGSIFDTTLGASAASVDVTSILGTYAHLLIAVYARGDNASLAVQLSMRFNGDVAGNYDFQRLSGSAAAASAAETFAATAAQAGNLPGNTAGANLFSATEIFIPHYANATNNKSFFALGSDKVGVATTNMAIDIFGGGWRSNAAINRVTLLPNVGNFVAGTRVTIYAMGA